MAIATSSRPARCTKSSRRMRWRKRWWRHRRSLAIRCTSARRGTCIASAKRRQISRRCTQINADEDYSRSSPGLVLFREFPPELHLFIRDELLVTVGIDPRIRLACARVLQLFVHPVVGAVPPQEHLPPHPLHTPDHPLQIARNPRTPRVVPQP